MATTSVPDTSTVRGILDRLIIERQNLRRSEADRATLEANRLAIVYWQEMLSRALLNERAA